MSTDLNTPAQHDPLPIAGSVKTPIRFDIETYPTLHKLTATGTARLDGGRTAVDVLAAMFPCGSVTGAPKIRAMEVIAATEQEARGVYTGSIGWLGPDGDAAFNEIGRASCRERVCQYV